jgi:hypothetical protein
MSLIKCGECGKEISSKAEVCPQCGAKPEKKIGIVGKIFLGFIALFVLLSFIGSLVSNPTSTDGHSFASAEDAAKAADEIRFQKAALVASAIKRSLRDPDSVKWAGIWTNDDASTICIEYRARNGFGGMNHEHVAVTKAGASQEAEAWNRSCANKQLHDLSRVRYALK